jgi:hypothetical protein
MAGLALLISFVLMVGCQGTNGQSTPTAAAIPDSVCVVDPKTPRENVFKMTLPFRASDGADAVMSDTTLTLPWSSPGTGNDWNVMTINGLRPGTEILPLIEGKIQYQCLDAPEAKGFCAFIFIPGGIPRATIQSAYVAFRPEGGRINVENNQNVKTSDVIGKLSEGPLFEEFPHFQLFVYVVDSYADASSTVYGTAFITDLLLHPEYWVEVDGSYPCYAE